MPILTVTPNAAVDKTYTVPGFRLDRVHRPAERRVVPGGKGINVARVYRTLGGDARATGFLGGAHGEYIAQGLATEGIPADFVTVAGESRVCIAIMDPLAGTQTELNENGPRVTPDDARALLARLRELLPGCHAVVLSGSLPPGTPTTLYREIIALAQEEFGVRAVLDASGGALAEGVQARPFLAKPNSHELEALAVESDGWGGAAALLREKYALPLAMVTAGARGAVIASADGVWEAVPPSVTVLSTVGSGDSLAAGFLWACERGESLPESLKLGVAAGTANAMTYGAGFCSREQIFALVARTRVNKIG